MPRRNYRWNSDIAVNQVWETKETSNKNDFVERDLKYPQHFYDLLNGLPLAPEKKLYDRHGLHPLHSVLASKPTELPG